MKPTHTAAHKWRTRIEGYDLIYDLDRRELLSLAAKHGATTPADAEAWWHDMTKVVLPGSPGNKLREDPIRPGESVVDGYCRLFRDFEAAGGVLAVKGGNNLANYQELLQKALQPAPLLTQGVGMVPWHNTLTGTEWAACTAAYLTEVLLLSNRTHLFVADADLVGDVVRSTNTPIIGEDLDLLPFPQTWVEFERPVKFANGYPGAGNLEVSAVGLWSVGNSPLRLAVLKTPIRLTVGLNHDGSHGERLIFGSAALFLMFWGRTRILCTADHELATHLGSDQKLDDCRNPDWQRVINDASIAAKNVYDFLTSRSFDYIDAQRPQHDFSKIKRFRHVQGGMAQGQRHYKRVTLNKEVQRYQPGTGREPEWIGEPHSVDMPGCFHRMVYCLACGDTHRLDLIGESCRKCGVKVGPTANIEVARYWHSPHRRGSGPLRDYVRQMA